MYFENSLLPVDLALLPSAAAMVNRIERLGPGVVADSSTGFGLPWKGGASVDGQLWPAADDSTLWIPAGSHAIQPAQHPKGLRLLCLNGDLKAAKVVSPTAIEFSYQSAARAIATFDRRPATIQIDGLPQPIVFVGPATVLLPRGQHVIAVFAE